MHIAFAANSRRIAKNLRNGLDRSTDIRLRLFLALELLLRIEPDRGQNRSCPSPKIFGAEILARDLTQIFVHILRSNLANLAIVIDVLKQILAGQVLAATT